MKRIHFLIFTSIFSSSMLGQISKDSLKHIEKQSTNVLSNPKDTLINFHTKKESIINDLTLDTINENETESENEVEETVKSEKSNLEEEK